MSVIPLTVFFSLLLVGTFVVLFLREQRRRHLTSPERDSLLPLADETPHAVGGTRAPRGLNRRGAQVPPQRSGPAEHDHDHDQACACRSGQRPPCSRCLRRLDEQEPAYF